MGKASAYNAGDPGLIPGSGRSPGKGNSNPLQYSCLENPMDGGAWWATVHEVAKRDTTERLHSLSLSLAVASGGYSLAVLHGLLTAAATPAVGFSVAAPRLQGTGSVAVAWGLLPRRRKRQPTSVFSPGKSLRTEEPSGLQSTGLQRVGHN